MLHHRTPTRLQAATAQYDTSLSQPHHPTTLHTNSRARTRPQDQRGEALCEFYEPSI